MDPIYYCEDIPLISPLCEQESNESGVEDAAAQMSVPAEISMGEKDVAFLNTLQRLKRLQSGQAQLALQHPDERSSSSWGDVVGAALSVLTLGIFSSTGCHSSTGKYPVMRQGEARVRLDLRGRDEVGAFYYIRQIHAPPQLQNLAGKEITYSKILPIARYQGRVLEFLQRRRVEHLFLESLDADLTPSRRKEWVANLRTRLQAAGVSIREGMSPAEEERLSIALLGVLGAGLVYAVLNPKVYLHRTATREENDLAYQKIDALLEKYQGQFERSMEDPEFRHVVIEERESWAVRELLDFYSRHPGQSAYLIFGAFHQFCDDFARVGLKVPSYSIWWDLPGQELTPQIPPACE